MRVIIAGGRNFNDYPRMCEAMTKFIAIHGKPTTVICGMARGADLLGKQWAEERGITVEEFPADWDRHGMSAGYKRNAQMAKVATHLVAFWDGRSRGTDSMIQLAREKGITIGIAKY
jgi:hypothetical protein